jgi:lipopolysaccharide biosynthesis glycosyltransferase
MQKEIYVWGAGHYGVLTALDLKNNGIQTKGFIDKNATQIKAKLDLPVFEPNEVIYDKSQNAKIVVAIQNEKAIKEVVEILLLAGLKKNIDFEISPLIDPPIDYFSSIEDEIDYYRNMLKKRNDIYFHDEETAKHLANTWNGSVNKPKNLRFIENAIPVVLCANEKYAPYLAVMLQSLLDHSSSQRKYHFIILERNFSMKIKDYLVKQVLKFPHCEIDFIDISSIIDEIPIVSSSSHVSTDGFSRLFIPYWFDKYSKVIYLDSDMIAKADIAELYDLDISDFCIGIIPCQITNWHLKHRHYHFFLASAAFIFLENWSRYINSGVLIFDTQKFKEEISYQDLFKFAIYFSNRYKKRYNDQDVLALLIKDNYFSLPVEWNYSWIAPSGGYRDAKLGTKIIHFICEPKPWTKDPEIEELPIVIEYRNYAMNVPLYIDSIDNKSSNQKA